MHLKKDTQNMVDPDGDRFGLLCDTDERFFRERQHHLMHSTETRQDLAAVKALMRNEEQPSEDGGDYSSLFVRKRKQRNLVKLGSPQHGRFGAGPQLGSKQDDTSTRGILEKSVARLQSSGIASVSSGPVSVKTGERRRIKKTDPRS